MINAADQASKAAMNLSFPVLDSVGGAESQTLSQTGKPTTPGSKAIPKKPPTDRVRSPPPMRDDGAGPSQPCPAPHPNVWQAKEPGRRQLPSEIGAPTRWAESEPGPSVPPPAFVPIDCSAYFKPADKVSTEIQKVAFDKWQVRYEMMVSENALNIKHLTLQALKEIHDAERAHITTEEQQALADTIHAADEARAQLEATQTYTMARMNAMRTTNDNLNIKFMRVFNGVDLNGWDGTRSHAIRLLGDAGRAEEAAKVKAKVTVAQKPASAPASAVATPPEPITAAAAAAPAPVVKATAAVATKAPEKNRTKKERESDEKLAKIQLEKDNATEHKRQRELKKKESKKIPKASKDVRPDSATSDMEVE